MNGEPEANKWLIPAIIMVMVVVIASVFVVILTNKSTDKPVKIISVSHYPDVPALGEEITISAVIENQIINNINVDLYSISHDGTSLDHYELNRTDKELFECSIGPYCEDTIIWFVFSAENFTSIIYSIDNFIHVGETENLLSPDFSISDVQLSYEFFEYTEEIMIEVETVSNTTISDIDIEGFQEEHYSGFGTGNSILGHLTLNENGDIHRGTIKFNLLSYYDEEESKGIYIYFIVVAEDDNGNYAISEPFLIDYFEIS